MIDICPTATEHAAHSTMCRMYRRDLDGRRELGIPLPADHPQLARALRDLDQRIGFMREAADESLPAGEGMHRWIFHHRHEHPALTQADLLEGSRLADTLVTQAAWSVCDFSPPPAREQTRVLDLGGGPRGAVPRG